MNISNEDINVIDVYENGYVNYICRNLTISFHYNTEYANTTTELYYNTESDEDYMLCTTDKFDYIIYKDKTAAYFISGNFLIKLTGYNIENFLRNIKE